MSVAFEPVPDGAAALLHDVRNSLAALRLIADGLRDGVVDMTPETGILDQLMLHVLLLEDLLDELGHPRGTRWGTTNERSVQIGSFLAQ